MQVWPQTEFWLLKCGPKQAPLPGLAIKTFHLQHSTRFPLLVVWNRSPHKMAHGIYVLKIDMGGACMPEHHQKRAAQPGTASLGCDMNRKYFFCVKPLIVQHFGIIVASIIINNSFKGIRLIAHNHLFYYFSSPIIYSFFPQK